MLLLEVAEGDCFASSQWQ